ncbi:MAG: phosphopentomutase [Spirochaetales bacterium]|nr:phosphopentomutase [Spirochaetales bacterium]
MKALVLVIDSFGIGALPDARAFGDEGAHTAGHICERVPGPKWDALKQMGLGNAGGINGHPMPGCEAVPEPSAFWGIMEELSPGKDTNTGHWELAGIRLDAPFQTFDPAYPSFPQEMVAEFERRSGRKVLGNCAASGTVIIEDFGREHMETGNLICYTSADSVFQIAAHEEIVPLDELYDYCRIARDIGDRFNVGRVIARPFLGNPGSFLRTKNRKDFSLPLPEPTIIDHLLSYGIDTAAVGKIGDIFNESGIVHSYHDKGNTACLERVDELIGEKSDLDRFIFVNLVDTDMISGHRRDPEGYAQKVDEISTAVERFIDRLDTGDLLVITADHGCDPTFPGTDHTREYVPVLAFVKDNVLPVPGQPEDPLGEAASGGQTRGFNGNGRRKDPEPLAPGGVGIRKGFFDMTQTLCRYFDVPAYPRGVSLF